MVRDIGVVVTVSQLWIASARIKGNPDRTSIASIRLEEERDRCLGFVPNFVVGMLGGTTPIAVVLGVYDGGRQRSGVSRNDVNSTSLRGGLLWGGLFFAQRNPPQHHGVYLLLLLQTRTHTPF